MGDAYKNLAVALGAAKEQAHAIVFECRRRGIAPSERALSVYLSLIVMHKRFRDEHPPPAEDILSELDRLSRACDGALSVIKPLIEAAMNAARDAHGAL